LQNDKNYHRSRCKKQNEEDESSIKKSGDSRNGLVGLQNLGNTCFMNTSLQCLSNCYELTEYFLKDLFKKDINKDNPIGTGGDLASSYASLLKNLWYGSSTVYSPWAFKRAIGGFQSMFSGYMQHDTQEFLNYLLDGLHEDLNRVLKKPLVDRDDSKKPDEIKSKEGWIGFLRRNQSLLVDLFYGQFKSTLYCPDPECQNISTCFDPYLSISLPLVSRTEPYELTCFFIFFDLSIKPLQLDVQFSTETTVMALRNKVSKMLKIHPFSFLIVKLENISSFDCYMNSQNLLKPPNYSSFSNNKKQQYFLFQIDPKIFYNPSYNRFISTDIKSSASNPWEENLTREYKETKGKIEKNKTILNELFDVDYEENEHGGTQEEESYYSKKLTRGIYKINVDENYGFNDEWLKVVLFIRRYDSQISTERRVALSYPRVVYLNKNWSLKYIHKYIFNYISNIMRITNQNDKDLSIEEMYEKYYRKIIEKYNNDINNFEENQEKNNKILTFEERRKIVENEIKDDIEIQKENNIPYRLRVNNNNTNKMEYSRSEYKNCNFCGKTQCSGCLLPFSEDITLREYINEIPKNESGKEIDNTYFFLHDRYKHFIGTGNQDFNLELTFVDDYNTTVRTLLEKEVIDFKVQQHERQDGINVIECFKNFLKLEKLEANNEWFCPDCKNHVRATKKMEIYNSPNIFIIHLKRFKNNSKIDTLVKFPLEGLDISDYVINKKNDEDKFIYDLFAVGNHFGSMGFGHYTAYAKNPFTKKWYDFDDSHVSELNSKDIVTTSAYVLFYRKRNLNETINLNILFNKKLIQYNEGDTEIIDDYNGNLNSQANNGENSLSIDSSRVNENNQTAMEIEEEEKIKNEMFIDLNRNNRRS